LEEVQGKKKMEITMMWKLAGVALAAAAIATAPVAGADNGGNNTGNTDALRGRCTGMCQADQHSQAYLHVTNPTALQHIPTPRQRL
jgi:hypothetical protein